MLARIETKVWAAMAGTGAGATLATAVLWTLGVYAWHASAKAGDWQAAVAAVPAPIAETIGLAITVAGTGFAGWKAPPSNNAGNPTQPAIDQEQLP